MNSDFAGSILTPELPLPGNHTVATIRQLFSSMQLGDAPAKELEAYWNQDWKRFLYTYGLVRGLEGTCLELGANPYFTTMLLKLFTNLDLTLANYFGPQFGDEAVQTVTFIDPTSQREQRESLTFSHFNTEQSSFPFPDAMFDVVLFCEILEHLQMDPVNVLREIKRVLKPGGRLVLTTPNVARLENVHRLIEGANIYDPYSGYGPYGRHNREYNKHDLARLLQFCGFDLEELFSADVHDNMSFASAPAAAILPLVAVRQHDLGQYLFSRSRSAQPARAGRPAWLYRSYPPGELVD